MSSRSAAAATRKAEAITRALAEELRHLRDDCGMSQRSLSERSGVAQSVISRIESAVEVPSIETYARLAGGLGGDLSIRVYPNTGPMIRDRHSARMTEALLRMAHSGLVALPEVGVRNPVRGWIDTLLVDAAAVTLIATEFESMPRRLEQLIRWARAKADALSSAVGFPFGLRDPPTVHRLLVIRDTEANRTLAATFATTLRAAYPADPWQLLAALRGDAAWPGSACIWAHEGRAGTVDLRPKPR